MIMTLYEYPLPNNGERYDLSQDELSDLLYKAYRSGFNHAKDVYDKTNVKIETASYPPDAPYITVKPATPTQENMTMTFESDWR